MKADHQRLDGRGGAMNLSRDAMLALERHFVGALSAPARTWLEPVPVSQLAFAGSAVQSKAGGCAVDFGTVDGGVFAAAVVASVAAVSAYGLVWIFLLRRLGTQAPISWMTLFFKSQLAKYLPGSVWQYAGRVGLAHGRGVPVQRALVSVAAETHLCFRRAVDRKAIWRGVWSRTFKLFAGVFRYSP